MFYFLVFALVPLNDPPREGSYFFPSREGASRAAAALRNAADVARQQLRPQVVFPLCFLFSMTTLDVPPYFSKSFLKFLLEFLDPSLTFCEFYLNPRCAAQQWYHISGGKTLARVQLFQKVKKGKRHAHFGTSCWEEFLHVSSGSL